MKPRRPRTTDRLRYERELLGRGVWPVAGVDEAGRGPLAGPVVAAAVVLPEGWICGGMRVEWRGLNDSKQLSEGEREAFYERLVREPGVGIGVGQVEAGRIDAINILQATHEAMRGALQGLQEDRGAGEGKGVLGEDDQVGGPTDGMPSPEAGAPNAKFQIAKAAAPDAGLGFGLAGSEEGVLRSVVSVCSVLQGRGCVVWGARGRVGGGRGGVGGAGGRGEGPAHVLVDGRAVPSLGWPQTAIVKGDALSYTIAAASVVAKVARDRLMVVYGAMFPGYGFAEHKGYGTPEHVAAIRRLGPCAIHRRSFAPFRPVERELFPGGV